jgi:hypothetical protein
LVSCGVIVFLQVIDRKWQYFYRIAIKNKGDTI